LKNDSLLRNLIITAIFKFIYFYFEDLRKIYGKNKIDYFLKF
jgi:hypothetical protein